MFFYYSLYLIAFALWVFTYRGYAFAYLWPGNPVLNNQAAVVLTIAVFITLTIFVIHFLDTRHTAPQGQQVILLFRNS